MVTKYVGVFCSNNKCGHFIQLSSHQTDRPDVFGTDVDPTTTDRGVQCPACGSTCHYVRTDVAHSESPDGSDPVFQKQPATHALGKNSLGGTSDFQRAPDRSPRSG